MIGKARNKARHKADATPQAASKVALVRSLKTSLRTNISAAALLAFGGVIATCMIILTFTALQLIEVSNTLKLQGRLQAVEQSTPVKHDVGGNVKNVFVTDGEVVREGQILISLGTDDLESDSADARRQMAFLLLQSVCLNAQRDGRELLEIPQQLKLAVAKLEQLEFMRRQARRCQNQLDQALLDRQAKAERLAEVQDQVNLHQRLAASSQSLQRRLLTMADDAPTDHPLITEMMSHKRLQRALQHSISASEAKEKLAQLRATYARSEAAYLAKITRELELTNDKMVEAEQTLSRSETLLQKRFVFASTSGRVQRMRVSQNGGRIAAGAYVLEIAPLTTDFEVLSRVNVLDIPDLGVGQQVQVRLSGGMPRPIWVPARVEEIVKTSANQRLVRIRLTREDLNKRDLLRGDHSLNGLGEQSEALISIQSESALRSLSTILKRQFKPVDLPEA